MNQEHPIVKIAKLFARPVPVSPGPAILPTEAEIRAADLEQEEQEDAARLQETPESSSPETEALRREARIRQAAYANYEKRGAAPGGAHDDWVAAERSVDEGSADESKGRKNP